jgi:hypothetical protein
VAGDGRKQRADGDAGTAVLGLSSSLFSEKREKGGEKDRAAAARGREKG